MGNMCGKESATADSFSTPGRTLGASAQPTRASVSVPASATTPGRILGGSETGRGDARRAAAQAAEKREEAAKARQTKGQGKLGKKLADQRNQTWKEIRDQDIEDRRKVRNADDRVEAINWN